MFILSQLLLKYSKTCKSDSIPSYSIVLGILLYATIYLYILYKHDDYVVIFNKFIIYIVGIDLLLSSVYYFTTNNIVLKLDKLKPDNTEYKNDDKHDESDKYESDYSEDENLESGYEYSEEEVFIPKIEEIEMQDIPRIQEIEDEKIFKNEENKIEEIIDSELLEENDVVKDMEQKNIEVVEISEKKRRGRPKREI